MAVRQRTDDDRTRREPARRGRRDVPGDLSTAETRARDASEARQTASHATKGLGTYLALSPSRSSTASWMPVEAPEGVIARYMPLCVYTSASTVGLPRESKIWRPTIFVMAAGVCFVRYSACGWTERTETGAGALAAFFVESDSIFSQSLSENGSDRRRVRPAFERGEARDRRGGRLTTVSRDNRPFRTFGDEDTSESSPGSWTPPARDGRPLIVASAPRD